ncbi:MAG: hypothetical protein Tsb0013_03320 [Phycisphaerales bacterium]
MRALLLSLFAVLCALTVVAHTLVLPEERDGGAVTDAYFAVGDDVEHPEVRALMDGFRAHCDELGLPAFGRFGELVTLEDAALRERYRAAFASYYELQTGRVLTDTVRLVWSTDANPAREVQMSLFRAWHLREYGQPVDITTDPSNRELTKSIVQSVAGAGPDIIEYIGASELRDLVDAGIALDITDYASEHGFGVETVFEAARSGVARANEAGEMRLYGYPCNVGYTVCLYHKDQFAQAGVSAPTGGWTIDEMRRVGEAIMSTEGMVGNPRFPFMNLGAGDAALGAGARFFPETTGAYSVYNSPETVAGLRAFRDLMYVHRTMPRPAEAASMSASTAGGFGSDVAGSAPGLFAQRAISMYIGGRWEYVTFAIANRDRVIVPAIDRRLSELTAADPEAALLRTARASLLRDVLVPLPEAADRAYRACLTEEDRAGLLHIGAVHVPTVTGIPYYAVTARGALINRALERDDPQRLTYALRFLRYLGSEAYNEQINGTYDSICGRVEYCVDEDGVSGPPRPLPGLEGFDAPVFTEAMLEYADPWQLSPYIGRGRLNTLVNEVLERVQANELTPEHAAARAEEAINRQIIANVREGARLRARWERETGIDVDALVVGLREGGEDVSLRVQIERLMRGGGAS